MKSPLSRRNVLLAAAVVAGGLLALAYTRYRHDIDPAYARIARGSQIAPTPCGPIEYAVRGEGPPVLVVHGAGGGFDQGLELADSIARAGFRVIAVSRFGYLRTPLPANASAPAQADAHACLLDSLDLRQAAIVGVSAGGPSALQFALRFPDRTTALVLLVPATYAPGPEHGPPRRMGRGTMFLLNGNTLSIAWNPSAGINTQISGDTIQYVIYNNLASIMLQPTGHPELVKTLSTLINASSITCAN